MRIRNGFVSNSSSSSFIINKKNLTEEQIELIKDHFEVGKKFEEMYWDGEYCHNGDEWTINDDVDRDGNELINGGTWMDNFPMAKFLSLIGVEKEFVKWDDDDYEEKDLDDDHVPNPAVLESIVYSLKKEIERKKSGENADK